tara:strand:- start:135 stop:536 length:402 start_codon:yes stop_codon:yes gene_type:complete
MTYKLHVIDVIVHTWSKEGQGEHVCNKGGFTIGSFDTIAKAKEELAEFFGYEPDYEDYVCGGDLGKTAIMANMFAIIENEDAYPDPSATCSSVRITINGGYIADYVVVIEKVSTVFVDVFQRRSRVKLGGPSA